LLSLGQEPLISCHENAKEQAFAELFDKYNLLTLPVIDDHNRLIGVITPDDVIAMLRAKL
jgi:Mg/Co/Ni transporter MgtE